MIRYVADALTITETLDDGTKVIESNGVYTVESADDLANLFEMFAVHDDDDEE